MTQEYDDYTPVENDVSKCPKCGSKNYVELIALERCDDCGYEVNYRQAYDEP